MEEQNHSTGAASDPPGNPPGKTVLTVNPATTRCAPAAPFKKQAIRYFGDYILLGEIARGGMGIVYRAVQISLDREVAIKMLHAGSLAGEAAFHRFQTEAEAMARLDHPNIVSIYEVGQHAGQQYLSMRLIEGANLTERMAEYALCRTDRKGAEPAVAVPEPAEQCPNGLKKVTLEPAIFGDTQRPEAKRQMRTRQCEIATLVLKVARAVHYAHQRGVLHRDLKPSNILLDGQGEPHVSDFGLARLVDYDQRQTRTEAVMGTPSYMSPEQASGRAKDVTTSADVYSLGAILYELLTGRPPFAGDSQAAIIEKVRHQDPPRPLWVNPAVDRDLETICLKCLEKEHTKRYVTAERLAAELQRYLDGRPIQARPISRAERAWRLCRRHPAITALGFAFVLALVAGAVVSTWQAVRATRAEHTIRTALREEARQRSYAVEQQKLAELKAHEAELRQAESLSAQAAALSSANWNEAKARYTEALGIFRRIGECPLLASVGLWERYRRFPQPISTIALGERAVVSPKGNRALSRYGDGGTALWDLPGNRPIRSWRGVRMYWLSDYCFSPEGAAALVRSGTNGVLEVVSAESGETLHRLVGTARDAGPVALSLGGKLAASGNQHGVITVWDVATGSQVKTLNQGAPTLESLSFSPNDRMLAAIAGLSNVSVTFWDSHTFNELRTVPLGLTNNNFYYAPSCRFSPDGRFCLVGDRRTTYLLDASSWSQRRVFEHVEGDLYDFSLAPDGRSALCLTASFESFDDKFDVAAFNLETGEKVQAFGEYDASSLRMLNRVARSLSPDWRTLLAGMYVWPVSLNCETRSFRGQTERVRSVTWSPDDRLAVSGSEDGRLQLWDVETGRELGSIRSHWGALRALAFHPHGQHVFSGGADGVITLWSLTNGAPTRSFEDCIGGVTCLAVSRDGALLLGGNATSLKVWEVATGRAVRSFPSEPPDITRLGTSNLVGFVSNVAISPDSRLAISGSHYGEVKVWEISTGKQINAIRHSSPLVAVGFTPDSRRCFIACHDGFLSLFDAEKPDSAIRLTDSGTSLRYTPFETYSAGLSPDGRFLVSCSAWWPQGKGRQSALRIWDVSSARVVQTIDAGASALECVAFSADGLRVLTGGPGAEAQIWDFSRGAKYAEFEDGLAKAWKGLKGSADLLEALSVIGEWYAFRGAWDWAAEALERIPRTNRTPRNSLTLARSYWVAGKLDRAREEFAFAARQDHTLEFYSALCASDLEGDLFHKRAAGNDSHDFSGTVHFETLVPDGLETNIIALNLLSGKRTVPNRDILERPRGTLELKPYKFKGLLPKQKTDGIFQVAGGMWPPDMAGTGPFYLLHSQGHYFLLTPANFARVFGPISAVSDVLPYLETYEALFGSRFGTVVTENFIEHYRGNEAPPELTRIEEIRDGFRVRMIIYQTVHRRAFYGSTILLRTDGRVQAVEPAKVLRDLGGGISF